jgi:hypothetical protein
MSQQKIKADIKKHGHHIIHVLDEGEQPNFSYTIGLFETYQLPEIIIIGLKQDLQQVLLNNLAYDYKQGIRFVSGKLYGDILDDYQCLLLEVDKKHYEEYFGLAMDHYQGENFPVMQLIWPTPSNLYPFDPKAPEGFKKWQPVLGNYKNPES